MKIYQYYPRALVGNGGATVAMWSWVRALKAAEQDVTVICDSAYVDDQPLAIPDVDVIRVPHRGSGRWRHPVNIEKYIQPDSILIVHSAFLAGNLVACLRAKKKNVRTVFVPHGAYENEARKRNRYLKALWLLVEGRIVDNALAIHAFVETEIVSIKEVSPKVSIIVAPTPVDIPNAKAWTGGGGYLAWFGRYDIEHKGLDLLIEAYKLIPEESRIPLRLRGRDSTNSRHEVEELVISAGLSDSITVGGPVEGDEKIRFLCDAEAFVMPSRWESFGIAFMEVLALNVPALASRNMSFSQILEDDSGAVITSIDPSKLARSVESFINDVMGQHLNVEPRKFVEKHLSYDVVGKQFVDQMCNYER